MKVAAPFFYPLAPFTRVYWAHLLGALLLAAIAYRTLRGLTEDETATGNPFLRFLRYCFPESVYGHASAIIDYKYYIVNRIAYAFVFGPVFLGAPLIATFVIEIFGTIPDAPPTAEPMTILLYTVAALIAFDFGIFFAHYLQHKVPLLWQFHKVHHSAQVLTPVTLYRMHPVDDLLNGAMTALTVGVTGGIIIAATGSMVEPIQFFQVNAFLFIYYLAGYNLRHTHIWLNYPRWLLSTLVSPAQHQIHHSSAEKHFDKNFGFVFSIWDRMAGTLYIPVGREELTFGLAENEDREFNSVLSLYILPFKKAAALLRRNDK